jgi:hypothetical protein
MVGSAVAAAGMAIAANSAIAKLVLFPSMSALSFTLTTDFWKHRGHATS